MLEKSRFLFKFYYIGSKKYYGSQRQISSPTIEGAIISALLKKDYITNLKDAGFEVASRTDKYVSARGASFSALITKNPILMEINSKLPREIGLWGYTKVPLDFSSRFNALYRHYKYILPLKRGAFQNNEFINVDFIKKACKKLEGEHDFKNFAKREKAETITTKKLNLASVNLIDDYLVFDFKSKSFLRQQIRRMISKLIEIGMCKLTVTEFLYLFNTSNYVSYQPANPVGLILWDIIYGDNIKFKIDPKSKNRMINYFYNEEAKKNLKKILFHIMQQDNIG